LYPRRFVGAGKHAWKSVAENRIANHAEHNLIEPEERPHEPGQINVPAAPDEKMNNLVDTLLHRPDAKRGRRRIVPRLT